MAKPPLPPPPPGISPISLDDDEVEFDPVDTGQLWAERPEERDAEDFAARLSEATANLEDIALGSITGDDTSSVARLPHADPVRGPPPARGPGPDGPSGQAGTAGRQALSSSDVGSAFGGGPGGGHEGGLELDLSRAGLRADQGRGQALAGQPRPGAIEAQTSKADLQHAVAQGLPVAEASKSMLARRSPVVTPERRTLFGTDPLVAWLVGAAIGLFVGLGPATYSAAQLHDAKTADLFAELESVVDQPLAIRAGTVRAPAAVRGEIEATYGATRNRFFLVWLAVALPITLALGLIRRPG